ncbi:SpoIIE family protein phosphatase [Leptospira sp. GIMC2001]|uniref:SpoIIE family protein phosphatase n=1 Tax=Leptospira sp. GIMC2001 TaxID=1513297 RepID=UPI00234B0E7F|nr:SpoIIE family protein phosphatase [Leptospira sp. GIMC2001]WCL50455.1 AAA family ATPase [Leptospira sp. GIMC2001]
MKYKELKLIHRNENTTISRYSNDNGELIVIKKANGNRISVVSQLRHEYELTKKLKIAGVIKPIKFVSNPEETYLAFHDFGGEVLSEFMRKANLDIDSILKIGINIAKTLGELHSKGIVHKDINPGNILLNENDFKIQIIDFGISTEVSRNVQSLVPPKELEGSLLYISPEQSGRMNRILDYRTDLYSLGITIYEMLTGILPFKSNDPMEIIHGHIAVIPKSPSEVNKNIPTILSQIVLKLLEKNAENRYQSGFGLAEDLMKCLANLKELESSNFPLGLKDNSGRLQIPQKLYGREEKIHLLLSTFEEVSKYNKRKLIMVTGFSGVGKSSLVQEIYKPITEKNGIYLSGKFDQFQKNIPYYALTQLFNQFCNYLLLEDQEVLGVWRTRIMDGIGNNARVLYEIIPDLELLLPNQPDIQELGTQEARTRFNLTFQNFFQSICTKELPLVIFIDDLQWADTASLNLLASLLSSEANQYFLPIGSYRTNEVDSSHPLISTLEEIRKSDVEIIDLKLENLTTKDVENILVESLKTKPSSISELSSLLVNRTNGNAFFINQFLLSMYEEGHLQFDHDSQEWKYNLKNIEMMQVSENLIELMTFKIQKLSKEAQRVLQLSSVIGNQFDLEFLSIIHDKEAAPTLDDLWESIKEGLIIPLNENYKHIRSGMKEGIQFSECEFKFLHDRVQQAAYNLIPESDKLSTHLRVGQLLLSQTTTDKLKDSILEIVTQLNMGRDLIESKAEKMQLLELNLEAAKKVQASNAYDVAKRFIDISLSLFSMDSWKTQYDLSLKVSEFAVEIGYVLGNKEYLLSNHSAIKENAKSIVDVIPSELNLILYYSSVAEFGNAIDLGLSILKQFKISLPRNPSPAIILFNLLKTQIAIGRILKKNNWEIKDLINLPVMTDKESILIIKVVLNIIPSVFFLSPNLFPLLVFFSMRFALKNGYIVDSATCISCYGLIQTAVLSKSNIGYEYAMLANAILEKLKVKYTLHITPIEFGIRHRKEHFRNSLPSLQDMLSTSLSQGYLPEVGYSIWLIFLIKYCSSTELQSLYTETVNQLKRSAHLNLGSVDSVLLTFANSMVKRLGEKKYSDSILERTEWEDQLKIRIESLNSFDIAVVSALGLDYFGRICNHELVLYTYSVFVKHKDAMVGYPINNNVWFFTTLAMLEALDNKSPVKEFTVQQMKKIIKVNCKELERWSIDAPMNYLHRWRIIEARLLIYKKGSRDAIETKFEEAIALAKENEFTNEEALANELACEFSLANGKKQYAKLHLREAIALYSKWGANAKVNQLEEKYPDLIDRKKEVTQRLNTNSEEESKLGRATVIESKRIDPSNLDFYSVLKSSNAIAEEIQLDKLLARVTSILVENAGAEKGYFILKEEESFKIQSSYIDGKINVLQNENLESSSKIPMSIVNLSIRTRKLIVVDEALRDPKFQKDEYIIKNQPISILVMPIFHKSEMIGLVYMENNRSAGVFTAKHAETLQLIASQAAISIENAKLYLNVQEVTAERSRIQTEMELAQKIQTSLLPEKAELKGYEVLGYMKTADEVGGDYYDTILGDGERQFAVIGDVSGHGVTSGLIMMMAQTTLHTIIRNDKESNTSLILTKANQTLTSNIAKLKEEKYMTMQLIEVEANGRVKYSGAHLDSIVYRKNTATIERLESNGFWLGMEDDIAPFLKEREASLSEGDLLFLYTDGVTEATKDNYELFGFDRLSAIIRTNGSNSLEEVRDAVLESLKGYETPDDVTMLILKKTKG